MPLLPITLVSFRLHAWIGWRIVPALAALTGWPASGWLFAGLLLLSAVWMPTALTLGRRPDKPVLEVVALWLGLLLMGLFSSLFVLTLLRDGFLLLAWLLAWLWSLKGMELVSLDSLQVYSAVAVPLLALAATGWGFWSARRTARVVRWTCRSEGCRRPCTALPWRRYPISTSARRSGALISAASWSA